MYYTNPKIYNPPIGKAHYRHFKMPDEWEPYIKQIIGKDGCNFIKATKKTKCVYIWHHRDTNIIEIWGPMNNIINGENCVREMASKYIHEESSTSNNPSTQTV